MIKSIIVDGNWSNRLLAAFLTGLFTLLFVIAAFFVLGPLFDHPPVSTRFVSEPNEEVCVGEVYDMVLEIKTTKTVIVFIYLSNQLPDGSHIIHPEQQPIMVIPHEGSSLFDQPIIWVVPDLPPGEYTRVLGVRGHDTDEDPLISSQKFVIAEDCDKEMNNAKRENSRRGLGDSNRGNRGAIALLP